MIESMHTAFTSSDQQLIALKALPATQKRFQQPNRSYSGGGTPISLSPEQFLAANIRTSHPSHRSLLRKMTCIKDGFFFALFRFLPWRSSHEPKA